MPAWRRPTRKPSSRLARCRAQGVQRLEVVFVTHLDRDHIGGIEATLQRQDEHRLSVAEVWFNGEPHLPRNAPRPRSIEQGEALGRQLVEQSIPWNTRFGGKECVYPPAVRCPPSTFPQA